MRLFRSRRQLLTKIEIYEDALKRIASKPDEYSAIRQHYASIGIDPDEADGDTAHAYRKSAEIARLALDIAPR
jgi:hypothetical protein